jgi:hypothetical protein
MHFKHWEVVRQMAYTLALDTKSAPVKRLCDLTYGDEQVQREPERCTALPENDTGAPA